MHQSPFMSDVHLMDFFAYQSHGKAIYSDVVMSAVVDNAQGQAAYSCDFSIVCGQSNVQRKAKSHGEAERGDGNAFTF